MNCSPCFLECLFRTCLFHFFKPIFGKYCYFFSKQCFHYLINLNSK
jgi:hypothetical protein